LPEKARRWSGVSKFSLAREFLEFLRIRKKWWLTPIILLLVLLGTLIILTEGSAIAPFIYALF
jgi:hypothetical protein